MHDRLDLHAHDFLVRFQDFVADLHHQTKRNVRFFQRDHRILQVALSFSYQLLYCLIRFLLQLIDFPQGLVQMGAEASLGAFLSRIGFRQRTFRAEQIDAFDVIHLRLLLIQRNYGLRLISNSLLTNPLVVLYAVRLAS